MALSERKQSLSLHQETNRDTDEVFRLVQSSRLEPHRKVNIRRVFLGQVYRDGLYGRPFFVSLYLHCGDAVLDFFVSAALDSHSHLDTSNSRAIITHYYHLLELLLIAVLLWRNCGHFLGSGQDCIELENRQCG